ncbi:MAG: cupin domain-containing protein [Chloroflexota bacterium]
MADIQWVAASTGMRRRVLADGEKLMLVEVHLDQGAIVAEHSHIHEQATYVIRGRIQFTLSGNTVELSAGQSIFIPSNALHQVTASEETLLLDTFSPPREDFRS